MTGWVTVLLVFSVDPGQRERSVAVWRELGRLAMRMTTCRRFSLVQSGRDVSDWGVLSEWESEARFHRFIRDSGVLWIERGTGWPVLPSSVSVWQDVDRLPETPEEPTERAVVHSIEALASPGNVLPV